MNNRQDMPYPALQQQQQQQLHLASKTFVLILATAALTWLSAVDVVTQLLKDPRKLMAQDPQYQQLALLSSPNTTPALGTSILLRRGDKYYNMYNTSDRNDTVPNVLVEVNLTDAENSHSHSILHHRHTQNYHRIVYLRGEDGTANSFQLQQEPPQQEQMSMSPKPQRKYSIDVYPQMLTLPSKANKSDTLEDLTRFYPQIDSIDDVDKGMFHIERRVWPKHEIDPQHCHPAAPEWQSASFPVCNSIHEKDMLRDIVRNDMDMVSKKGFWRQAWGSYDNDIGGMTTQDHVGHNETTATQHHPRQKLVWKTFKIHHCMEDAFFESNRVDALAMERLTASPAVINIYGFCAMTVVQEFAGRQIHERPMSPTENLEVAIQIASGIRDVHYIDDADRPVLVHNDINLANILLTDSGRPILNDFNVAILLMERHNGGKQGTSSLASSAIVPLTEPNVEVCPFYSRFPNPQWRSPEEQVESEEESKNNPPVVDYKIDMYALGNVLYRLLVGSSPWKRMGASKLSSEEKLQVALAKRYNGSLPDLPNTTNLEDPANQILKEAMEMCYRFHPQDRPTAKELVKFLLEAKQSRLVATEWNATAAATTAPTIENRAL